MLLSLVLVWVSAQSRPTDLPLRQEHAGLASVQVTEPEAILVAVSKLHRAPDIRSPGDPELASLLCAPPALAFADVAAGAFCAGALPVHAPDSSRPEPRAPPLA